MRVSVPGRGVWCCIYYLTVLGGMEDDLEGFCTREGGAVVAEEDRARVKELRAWVNDQMKVKFNIFQLLFVCL